jgi:hypothetical protein
LAFVIWFVWAFLNDSQGRLYGWTDGKCGVPPLAVREQIAKDQQDKINKAKADKDAAKAGVTVTNAVTSAAAAVSTNAPAK